MGQQTTNSARTVINHAPREKNLIKYLADNIYFCQIAVTISFTQFKLQLLLISLRVYKLFSSTLGFEPWKEHELQSAIFENDFSFRSHHNHVIRLSSKKVSRHVRSRTYQSGL